MKIAPQRAITVYEFLAWSERQDRGRFELFDGEFVMQSERAEHWEAKAAVWSALNGAIKRAELNCHAAPDGATIRISDDTAFEPDALVYCGEKVPRKPLEVPNPIIVVEVLSDATASYDMSYKRRGYFSLPSAQHYLVVDPDKRIILHYRRSSEQEQMPTLVSQGSLNLEPAWLTVGLAEIFSG